MHATAPPTVCADQVDGRPRTPACDGAPPTVCAEPAVADRDTHVRPRAPTVCADPAIADEDTHMRPPPTVCAADHPHGDGWPDTRRCRPPGHAKCPDTPITFPRKRRTGSVSLDPRCVRRPARHDARRAVRRNRLRGAPRPQEARSAFRAPGLYRLPGGMIPPARSGLLFDPPEAPAGHSPDRAPSSVPGSGRSAPSGAKNPAAGDRSSGDDRSSDGVRGAAVPTADVEGVRFRIGPLDAPHKRPRRRARETRTTTRPGPWIRRRRLPLTSPPHLVP